MAITYFTFRGCGDVINLKDKKHSSTALHYAIKNRSSQAAITLLENGAEFCLRTEDEVSKVPSRVHSWLLILAYNNIIVIMQKSKESDTALHEACLAGLLE